MTLSDSADGRDGLAARDVGLLHAFVLHPQGQDDLDAHDRLLALLPAGDPRAPGVALRAARLRAE